MRKYIKNSLWGLVGVGAVLAPVTIIISSKANSSDNGISIVGQGSSSVKPVIDIITKETSYDIQYAANGSGKGYESQAAQSPLSAFGMTSSLKHPKDQAAADNWEANNIKTLTFAIDAIGIVLNLPSGIKYDDYKTNRPIIDIEELSKLYDTDPNTQTTWGELLLNEPDGATGLDSNVISLGRDGGKSASGTSDGFWHTLSKHMYAGSKPDLNHDTMDKELRTPEANAQALNIMQEKDSSLTYLSLGFALNNETDNSIVATIDDKGEKWVPTIDNVKNKSYKWTRPFNILYSTKNEDAINFANFLLSPVNQRLIEDINFVPLTVDQIRSQLPLDASDVDNGANLLHGDKMGLSV